MQMFSQAILMGPAFNSGMMLSLSLIMALGPQNAHVLRMGLQGQHVWLTIGVCIASDVLLIGLGVLGLAQLGGLSDIVRHLLVGGGILFLLVYGWQAFVRCCAKAPTESPAPTGSRSLHMSRRQATLAALAFAWLNPHAWLDTAVLIGTASLAWGAPGNALFGLGAATGSAVWFVGLGLCIITLGKRLRQPNIWRVMDGLVALMMWGTALALGLGLMQD